MKSSKRRENFWGYLLILPQLIGVTFIYLLPLIAGLGLSFFKWDLGKKPAFVGISNYIDQLTSGDFWISMSNTLQYTVMNIAFGVAVALALALLLNKVKFKIIYRTIFFSPAVINSVAASLVWIWLFNKEFGIINSYLKSIGINGPGWLIEPRWAMLSIVIMSVWWYMGYNMVIMLAGLQGIPSSYYEAATIDGANLWQRLMKITIPLLTPVIFFITVMAAIDSFKVFDQVFLMTRGGPAQSTDVIVLHIYRMAFTNYQMGKASTGAVLLFIIIMALTLFQFKMSKRWVFYNN